jgi:hypothetical protein
MADGLFLELLVLCSTAGGLVLLGASTLVLSGRGLAVRLAAVGGAATTAAAVLLLFDYPAASLVPAGLVALVGTASALLGSARVNGGLVAGVRRLGRPGLQTAVLSVAGAVLLIGSLSRYDDGFSAVADEDLAFMVEVTWKPPLEPAVGQVATTDAGRPVALWTPCEVRSVGEVQAAERRMLDKLGFAERVIRVAPPAEGCNCHGWVFTGGRYWLDPEDVEHILADNGYQVVSQPHVGDVVIYREIGSDRISHTAVVRTATPGGPVLVEGKWGWMGAFMHPPEGSCYGRKLTFYRGPREGHLLVGLGGRAGGAPVTNTSGVGQ